MGSGVAKRRVSRVIATAVYVWVLTAAGPGTGIVAGTTTTVAAAAATAEPGVTDADGSLWAVAYCVEFRDAGLFRLVYAGYLRPVTAGWPAPARIATAPALDTAGSAAEGTGTAVEKDSPTGSGWPDGVTITAAELTAALQRGHGREGGSQPPPLEEVGEGTVLLLLARPAEDWPAAGPAGNLPSSLAPLKPLVMFIDPEGSAYRRQLVESLLEELGVAVVSHSSGPSPGAAQKRPAELPAGPGI